MPTNDFDASKEDLCRIFSSKVNYYEPNTDKKTFHFLVYESLTFLIT